MEPVQPRSVMLMENPSPPARQHGIIHGTDLAHKRGLRAVASIEFLKGLAGVGAAIGLLVLRHKDIWDIAENTLEFFHIDTDRHFAQVLLDFADQVTSGQLTTLAALAFVYSGLRFLEAYGLWRTRVWAEWLAILSGLVYIPLEIRALLHQSTPFRWGALILNIALVGYVAYVRTLEIHRCRKERAGTQDKVSRAVSLPPDEPWRRSG
jgi:uncharacterized membrane protein (DUF2068 family)